MTKITSYKELTVWQKSYELTLKIYLITEKFPKKEDFSLTSQMRRCSLSVPSNIAKKYRRNHRKEFIQFLQIAYGSASELEVQLLLTKDINYITKEEYETYNSLLVEVLKMLNVLLTKLKQVV